MVRYGDFFIGIGAKERVKYVGFLFKPNKLMIIGLLLLFGIIDGFWCLNKKEKEENRERKEGNSFLG